MELNRKTVSVCKSYKQIKTKTNVEADVIVPDTKPDIYRILSVRAVPDVSERYIRKDKIIFSGNVKFTVLYVGEGDTGKIFSIEYSSPFNHQADMHGVDDNFLSIGASNVSKTIYDVKNSRKLSVGASLDLSAEAICQNDMEVIDGDNDFSCVASKTKTYKADTLKAIEEFEISLSDTVTLPTTDEMCEIYDISIRPDISEIKTVNNKAIVKGNANIYIIYSADSNLCSYDTEATFTEIVDIDSISSEHTVFSHFETAQINHYKSVSDTSTQLDIDFKLRGSICAYESGEYNVVSDIYSPDYNYNAIQREAGFMHVSKCEKANFTLKDTVTISDTEPSISKIYYMDTFVSAVNIKKENDSVIVSGKTENIIVYADENGNLNRIRNSTPFESEILSVDNSENANINIDVTCTNSSYALTSSKEIQVRTVLSTDTRLVSLTNADFITDFSVDDTKPKEDSMQPSIVVYYPDKNDDIWDIAKKYNTKAEDIIEINSLDPSLSTLSDKPILIPKRSVNKA